MNPSMDIKSVEQDSMDWSVISIIFQITWEEENSSHQQSVNLSSLETTIPFLSLDKSYLFKVCPCLMSEVDQEKRLMRKRKKNEGCTWNFRLDSFNDHYRRRSKTNEFTRITSFSFARPILFHSSISNLVSLFRQWSHSNKSFMEQHPWWTCQTIRSVLDWNRMFVRTLFLLLSTWCCDDTEYISIVRFKIQLYLSFDHSTDWNRYSIQSIVSMGFQC